MIVSIKKERPKPFFILTQSPADPSAFPQEKLH